MYKLRKLTELQTKVLALALSQITSKLAGQLLDKHHRTVEHIREAAYKKLSVRTMKEAWTLLTRAERGQLANLAASELLTFHQSQVEDLSRQLSVAPGYERNGGGKHED